MGDSAQACDLYSLSAAVGGRRPAAPAPSNGRVAPDQAAGHSVSLVSVGLPRLWPATWVAWPAGVPTGTYGLWVQAITALYTGAYRLSKRTTHAGKPLSCAWPCRRLCTSQGHHRRTMLWSVRSVQACWGAKAVLVRRVRRGCAVSKR